MANKSRERADILKSCKNLGALMTSVQFPGMLKVTQDLKRIEDSALTQSESNLSHVADDLANLIQRLRTQEAGDGSTVITHERWEQFFGDSDNRG